MSRARMCILYSGRVQGVGFRYTAKTVSTGYDVTGTVRNLSDGRVELIAEGEKSELEAFREGIRETELSGLTKSESVSWATATGEFRGFEILR